MNNVNYRQLHAKADINNGRRAFSDAHNHIVVRLNGVEHGFDLACALRLQEDLSRAIRNAALSDDQYLTLCG